MKCQQGATIRPATPGIDDPAGSVALSWLTLLILALAVLPALIRPAEFFKDDSYFYLQIAGNIVDGLGSTFHGLTPTNGYHPLWMAGAIAAMWLAAGDKTTALHLVVMIQVGLVLGTMLVFLRLARSMALQAPLVGLTVVLGYLVGTGLYGSEAHLNALLMTAGLLSLWHTLADGRLRWWLATGLAFGLSILARLDNVFVVAALCAIGVVYANGRQPRFLAASATALAIGGLAMLAPYLAWNMAEFGHLMPISGAIKSTFPSFSPELNRLGSMGKIAALAGGLALLVGRFLDHDRRRQVIWYGLGTGVMVHAFYVVGFTDHYTYWAWYYVPGVLAAGLAVAYLAGRVATMVGRALCWQGMGVVMVALALSLLLGIAARTWLKAFNPVHAGPVTIDIPINEYRWTDEFGKWMRQNMPAGSRVFVFDWPGAIAFYSGMQILPMDGLVNDFNYNDDLLESGVEQYLCTHGVEYYFGLIEDGVPVQKVAVMAPLYRQPAGELSLYAEDIVARVLDVVSRPDEALPFALWRVRCASSGAYEAYKSRSSILAAATRSAASAAAGLPVTAVRKLDRSSTSSTVGSSATTVAVRGMSRSSAISPNESPGVVSRLRKRPSFDTVTAPDSST